MRAGTRQMARGMWALALAAAASAPGVALGAEPAMDSAALSKARNCMACHAVEQKVVGPSYREIAQRYLGQGAEARMANAILKGGAGAWSAVPMPANLQVSAAEAAQLAAWILSTK